MARGAWMVRRRLADVEHGYHVTPRHGVVLLLRSVAEAETVARVTVA